MRSPQEPFHDPREAARAVARGTLRDGLGALGNLAILSGSVRVGSRAIARVLPDVLASCSSMRAALDDLVASLTARDETDGAGHLLGDYVAARLDELERELTGLTREPFRTSERLDLDRMVARLSGELDAAHALLELLDAATHEPAMAVQLGELLSHHLTSTPSGRRPQRRFNVVVSSRGALEAVVRPRAFAELMALEAEVASAAGIPHVELSDEANGLRIAITARESPEGEPLRVWGYGLIDPTSECVRAAATCLGLERTSSEPGAVSYRAKTA
jgi:hypothetical protein